MLCCVTASPADISLISCDLLLHTWHCPAHYCLPYHHSHRTLDVRCPNNFSVSIMQGIYSTNKDSVQSCVLMGVMYFTAFSVTCNKTGLTPFFICTKLKVYRFAIKRHSLNHLTDIQNYFENILICTGESLKVFSSGISFEYFHHICVYLPSSV